MGRASYHEQRRRKPFDALKHDEAAVTSHVQQGDGVLELGCQLGAVTRALANTAAYVVGVDMAREVPQRRASNP